VKVLGLFPKNFKLERPILSEQEWFFYWDNSPVHTAAVVREWYAANAIQLIPHPPYSPDLAPADFFLFRRVKEELAGFTLSRETIKKAWEGVIRTIAIEDCAAAFRAWYDRSQKCIRIGGDFVEKNSKINTVLPVTIVLLFQFYSLILYAPRIFPQIIRPGINL